MASQDNGGISIPGNLTVFGDGDINGDLNVDGSTVVQAIRTTAITAQSVGTATILTTGAVTIGTSLLLTPIADAPTPPAEGMIYADTDHKLYFYNGTSWQEVSFAGA